MNSKNRRIERSFTLETNRFLLRIPSLEDIPHIFSATRYKGFNDGMLWEPPEKESDLEASYHFSLKAWGDGSGYTFGIDEKETCNFVGRIVIRQTEEPDVWNTGFWTHPEQQGKGAMTEVLGEVLSFGFSRLGAIRVEAYYATWNEASKKVLERNGMQFIKHVEKGFQKNGKWVAENLMAIEWEVWEVWEGSLCKNVFTPSVLRTALLGKHSGELEVGRDPWYSATFYFSFSTSNPKTTILLSELNF